MKVAFLFGAGASLGAGSVEPKTPPSGACLYECLREACESWRTCIEPEEDKLFRSSPPFERGMEALWQKNDERAQRLLTDMAIYFCQFRLGSGSNCYSDLLDLLNGRRLVPTFATLNYECLFEYALKRIDRGLTYGLSGSIDAQNRFLKLHGSCNWVPASICDLSLTVHDLDPDATAAEINLKAVDPAVVASLYDRPNIPPAMSLFAPGKRSPYSRSEIQTVREYWKSDMTNAEIIVVIGARPVFADSHVWDPILSSDAPVWHVGGSTGDDFTEYEERLGSRLERLPREFDKALPQLDARLKDLGH